MEKSVINIDQKCNKTNVDEAAYPNSLPGGGELPQELPSMSV